MGEVTLNTGCWTRADSIRIPIVGALIEVAKVGFGGDDSAHRADIKAKQSTTYDCHCSDTISRWKISKQVDTASI